MEKLNKKNLSKYLTEDFVFLKKTTSTFDEINPGIVIAASQKNGHGRLDRVFCSPKGGIYLSVIAKICPLLTIRAAAGVMRSIEKKGLSPQVKWVNDIFLNGGKMCGILVREQGGKANIGVGINYAPKKLPSNINASRIQDGTEGINEFTALVILEIKQSLCGNGEKELAYYRERLLGRGKEILLDNGERGVLVDIDSDGALIYTHNGKEKRINYGDIYL